MTWVMEEGKDPVNGEWFFKTMDKLTDPQMVPYLAAFSYGALAAYESHREKKDKDGKITQVGLEALALTTETFRQGVEAILFLDLARTNSASLAGNASQIFGVAGLTAIGLQVPLSAIAQMFSGSKDPTKTFGITNPDLITNFNKWFAATFPWAV